MKNSSRLTRRHFLKLGGTAAAGATLNACALRPPRTREAEMAGFDSPASVSELDAFNYVVGTQTFSPKYQFTGKPWLVETAEVIRAMGASVIKFRLDDNIRRGAQPENIRTLRDVAARDPAAKAVLDMAFGHYLIWTYPMAKEPGQSARDEELYDLCCYLLKTYNGTRKTFYLGHWEGDWEIRGRAGSREDPTPQSIAGKIGWLNRRQQAVDDAKRDTPHHHVDVFCYAEANLVRDCMQGRPGMANEVIPHTQIDFVSYSSYDTSNYSGVETRLPEALDYIESRLSPKPAIKGRRVWIGEYGYPASRHSPAEQAARTRQVIRAALQWGCPFVLYWEMYNNELDKDGKQRGFWLIDDQGVKQPVYYTHQRFLQWARGWVADFAKRAHRLPTFDEYRGKAIEFLDA
ncbi:MAG: twin-arginine translocation signal domain-containing protein, partial [Verrucomicrobiota bacterium]